MRWEHPEHGLLAPDAFVPLAQHIGLIRHLTHYVLDAALRQARPLRHRPGVLPHPSLSR